MLVKIVLKYIHNPQNKPTEDTYLYESDINKTRRRENSSTTV